MLKTIISVLLINFALICGASPTNDTVTITVTVDGFRNQTGKCRLLLFDSKKGFPDSPEHAKLMLSSDIRSETVEFSFSINPGSYAIAILHDENSNGKLDKTWYGKPEEGFGTSNNPKIRSGPPGFGDCVVQLDKKNNSVNIKLKYI